MHKTPTTVVGHNYLIDTVKMNECNLLLLTIDPLNRNWLENLKCSLSVTSKESLKALDDDSRSQHDPQMHQLPQKEKKCPHALQRQAPNA